MDASRKRTVPVQLCADPWVNAACGGAWVQRRRMIGRSVVLKGASAGSLQMAGSALASTVVLLNGVTLWRNCAFIVVPAERKQVSTTRFDVPSQSNGTSNTCMFHASASV